jgi:ABC-type transport system involved in cytochrome bd biosynthesis fused ATPase/permease subunit
MNKLASTIKSIETIDKRIHETQTKLDSMVVGTIDDLNVEKQKLDELKTNLQHAVEHNSYVQMKQLHDNYNLQLTQNRQKAKENDMKLRTIMKFSDKVVEAETIALTQLIQTLNAHIQMYLDIFFEKDPIQARIESTKETKNKKIKNQLNMSIISKGNSVDLKSLSTGEYDRVALAVSLSIQSVLNNPILLLDECVSSLDQENADNVFQCIREFHKDKLVIIVAHQIVTGIFDQVIQL